MKAKIFAPLMMLMLMMSSLAFAQKKDNGKESVLFDVSLHCENCKKKVERNIAYEKGVTDLKVDLENKTVWVEFRKDKTSVQKLEKAIEKLGYEVQTHTQEPKEAKE